MSSSLIEGDTVYLEYTKASVVRGSRITLGPGCVIGLAEYKEQLDVLPGASVGESRQM